MSTRELCISVIDSMPEWQLSSVLAMLQTVKTSLNETASGTLETLQLLSDSEMKEKLMDGKNTPLSDCIPESEVVW